MQTLGTILFVGHDACARTPVLTASGYHVLHCHCDPLAIIDVLMQVTVDAILFTCDPEPPAHLINASARAASDAPIILFAHNMATYHEEDYDLVLPPLCSPQDWLPPLSDLVAFYRNPNRPKPSKAVAIDAPQKNRRYNPTR